MIFLLYLLEFTFKECLFNESLKLGMNSLTWTVDRYLLFRVVGHLLAILTYLHFNKVNSEMLKRQSYILEMAK